MENLTPNNKYSLSTVRILIIAQIILFFTCWIFLGFKSLPSPREIIDAIIYMQQKYNLLFQFRSSVLFCLKCILLATFISIILSYLALMQEFRPIIKFITKFRFLGVLGLSFYVLTLMPDSSNAIEMQKTILMTFSIGIFLLTAIQAEILSATKDELDYGKTLKMNPWRISWEINILSRMDKIWEIMKQNFAIAWVMLPAIEYLAKSSGGIGVLLVEANKYMKIDWLWAVQTLVVITGIFVDLAFRLIGKFIYNYSPLYK